MTCAACHTRQIEIDGKPIRIDGGPAIVDFGSLLDDMDKAFGKVLDDDAAFAAFATAVLGSVALGRGAKTIKGERRRLVRVI